MAKKIMIFIERTLFFTRFPIFLFSKYGYKPMSNAVEIVNGWQKLLMAIVLKVYFKEGSFFNFRKLYK